MSGVTLTGTAGTLYTTYHEPPFGSGPYAHTQQILRGGFIKRER